MEIESLNRDVEELRSQMRHKAELSDISSLVNSIFDIRATCEAILNRLEKVEQKTNPN